MISVRKVFGNYYYFIGKVEMVKNQKNIDAEILSDNSHLANEVPSQRFDLRILQALRRIIHVVDVQSRRVSERHGVTVPQIICLHKIVESGPMTTNALSKEIFLAASTVIGILDRLEAKGYISRTRDSTDRRLVYVDATPEGKVFLENSPDLIH